MQGKQQSCTSSIPHRSTFSLGLLVSTYFLVLQPRVSGAPATCPWGIAARTVFNILLQGRVGMVLKLLQKKP